MEFTTLKPDTLLHHGSYKIIRVLGQGGYGITYLAHDINLDKQIAIKEFFPKMLCGRESTTNNITLATGNSETLIENLKSKFIKEARNIAKLNNPNIIRIFAAFEENNTAYYAMEYIEGSSLSDIVKKNGAITEKDALQYIFQIGGALEYLHQHRMTHLDVKPANIMVRKSDNIPILIDFGLSKNYDIKGFETTTLGLAGISPGFSPIEQYKQTGRLEFSPKSDLYSLAATLYYLLTAEVPPEAPTITPENLNLPGNISSNTKEAIFKALSISEKNRHESIKDFINHLQGKTSHGSNSEDTLFIDNEHTLINENSINNDTSHDESVSSTLGTASSLDFSTPTNNKGKKNSIIIFILAIAILAAGIIIIIMLKNDSSSRHTIDPNEEIIDTASNETLEEQQNTVSENKDSVVPTNESLSSVDEKTSVVENKPAGPYYGPFSSKSDLTNYLESYYYNSDNDNIYSSYIADVIVTDFGQKMQFTRAGLIDQLRKYENRRRKTDQDWSFNWNTLKTYEMPNGAVKVTYTFQSYQTLEEKNGSLVTKQYNCNDEVIINANRQISYYKERAKLVGEW